MNLFGPAFLAAFLASLVELVEALTIVLAVGVVRGWRPALTGAAAAAGVLAIAVLAFGARLAALDFPIFKLIVGTLLLLFGLRWLRKAILRAAGVILMHDEAKIFARETAALESAPRSSGFDLSAALTSFNGVFIEGVEVVFIVLAVGGAGKQIVSASLGAAAAAVLVLILGVVARHPLTRIPENALKMMVGVLVSAFGTFWVGDSLRFVWPGADFALIFLSASYAAIAGLAVAVARRAVSVPSAALEKN